MLLVEIVWTDNSVVGMGVFCELEGMGASSPLLLAPAEGLGGTSRPPAKWG